MYDRDGINYHNDPRVRAGQRGSLFETIDTNRMTATIRLIDEEDDEDGTGVVSVKVRYEVCSTCQGKGSHVNPSVDCDGLTADDFAEDPDFADDYMSGAYDVQCYGCHGNRVELVIDEEHMDEGVLDRVHKKMHQDALDRAQEAHERRMGY